jgi:ABC-2 type transport system ATP-binding protein
MNPSDFSSPAIEVTDVSKRFKDLVAVDNLSINLNRGEFLALLGPNGAGKTTLVEMIEGLQKPTQGTIKVLGLPWHGNEVHLHKQIGISLQETHFIDKLRTGETLMLFASFYGLGKTRVAEILDLIGLVEKARSFVVNLSGGQRQRLALGVALLNSPRLLLLDEPTTGLDPGSRREIWDILTKLKIHEKITLILTTHYMEEAAYLCDRIIIMDQGRIIAKGTLDELLIKQDKGEIIEFIPAGIVQTDFFKGVAGIRETIIRENGKVHLVVDNTVKMIPLVLRILELKQVGISSLECRKYTLDDLFIDLTGRKLED